MCGVCKQQGEIPSWCETKLDIQPASIVEPCPTLLLRKYATDNATPASQINVAYKKTTEDERRVQRKKQQRQKRDNDLKELWITLPSATQERLWQEAMDTAPSDFDLSQAKCAKADGKLHFLLLRQLEIHVAANPTTAL